MRASIVATASATDASRPISFWKWVYQLAESLPVSETRDSGAFPGEPGARALLLPWPAPGEGCGPWLLGRLMLARLSQPLLSPPPSKT